MYKNYFQAAITTVGTPLSDAASVRSVVPNTPDSATTDDDTPQTGQHHSRGGAEETAVADDSNFLNFFAKQQLVPSSDKPAKSMFVDDEADDDDDVAGDEEMEDTLDAEELENFIATGTPRKEHESEAFFAQQLQDDQAELQALADRFVRPHNPLVADALRATQSLPVPSFRNRRISASTTGTELEVPLKQRKISYDEKLIQVRTTCVHQ